MIYLSISIQIRTRNEYVAWDTLLRQRLGLRFFLWDISLMGHFSLTKRISTSFSKESTTTLMKDHVGKTFIILNNEFEYVYGDESRMVTALDFMVKQEVGDATVCFVLFANG